MIASIISRQRGFAYMLDILIVHSHTTNLGQPCQLLLCDLLLNLVAVNAIILKVVCISLVRRQCCCLLT